MPLLLDGQASILKGKFLHRLLDLKLIFLRHYRFSEPIEIAATRGGPARTRSRIGKACHRQRAGRELRVFDVGLTPRQISAEKIPL